ncbi:25S rRNA (adenine2142-N1)-methyltransferase [Coemansia erecta]|uniref:25S rRNA adenine-N(1) methyltransferase n=1 Tax=Coemansia erecta TaxID=147472 RepID=A0A9W8CRH1_9FUNG|nr:25S rRNA (adenine2142-N1)-methyltransferase [Coemansia erecta]
MPKTRTKRPQPVTSTKGRSTTYDKRPVALPPIHIDGQQKVTIDTAALSAVKLGKLGKSSVDTRRRINHFHTLIKQYSKLETQKQNTSAADELDAIDSQIAQVSREMAEMGGLDWYQKASLLGQCKQRGGDTSRWLVPRLHELGLDKREKRLRLLEVGALSSRNYEKEHHWIDVVPIDLNSQEPGIYQLDFLDIKIGSAEQAEPSSTDDDDNDDDDEPDNGKAQLFGSPFEVISLSLVVNFIGDPGRRGDMLRQAAKLLTPDGLLFLVLPRSCVANSRYLDDERLLAIMECLGFAQLQSHHTAKLAHYLYRFNGPSESNESFKKKLLYSEGGRNNFSIVI